MIGFCSSPGFIRHDTGPGHPERPDRIRAIYRAVIEAGLLDIADPFPEFAIEIESPKSEIRNKSKMVSLAPALAEQSVVELVHPKEYIEHVRRMCHGGGFMDADTPVMQESYEAALLSVGALLTLSDAIMDGRVKRGFCAARPPGHHAEPHRAMGFCLFSNVAIAARYLQKKHGVGHVAVVDFDVHHGNGTQAAFEDDPSVLFISLHQDPRTCYPGTGYASEVGEGAGRGYTLNIPLPPGSGDEIYLRAFDQKVLPKLDDFKPEVLLISAGFDAHADDPLAQMEVSEEGFGQMTGRLCATAVRHCGGRTISALEGGYNLRALGRSVVSHLLAMSA